MTNKPMAWISKSDLYSKIFPILSIELGETQSELEEIRKDIISFSLYAGDNSSYRTSFGYHSVYHRICELTKSKVSEIKNHYLPKARELWTLMCNSSEDRILIDIETSNWISIDWKERIDSAHKEDVNTLSLAKTRLKQEREKENERRRADVVQNYMRISQANEIKETLHTIDPPKEEVVDHSKIVFAFMILCVMAMILFVLFKLTSGG